MEFVFFFDVIYFISQDSLMASAERKRGWGGGGRREENWSSFTSESREGTEEEAQCHESFTGRSTLLADQSPLRLEEEEETGGRAEERVNRGAVSLWSVGLLLLQTVPSPRPSSLVPPGFDRSIGRNVTGPRHSRQS